MIDLVVRPGPALIREQFLADHPGYSVALDGYVFGAPWLTVTPAGPYRNFNHHEAVDRSCMSATCEQVRRAVILGFYDLFRQKGERCAQLYVNDCDQDVCLSTWILMNPDQAVEPLVRTISQVNDLLDMSGGVFPMPHERDLLGQVRWVFDPYLRVRPHLVGMAGEAMREVIRAVHHRLDQFAMGRAEVLGLSGTVTQIGGGTGWVFAEISHQTARLQLVASGVRAAIELFGRTDNRYLYALWRRSEYVVGFPLRQILGALNLAEDFQFEDPTGWGGADNVGGSPRGRGSALPPTEVERIVNRTIAEHVPTAAGEFVDGNT